MFTDEKKFTFFKNSIDICVIMYYILTTVTITIIILQIERRFTLAALKYSRQRECIKSYLAMTKEHPTADTVYLHVKKEFPNISLGTVYRNLNLLTDIGEAIKIPAPDGGDRFDGNIQPHNHFFCTSCRKVLDLDLDMKNIEQVNKAAAENFDGIIESSTTIFYGKCGDCIQKS